MFAIAAISFCQHLRLFSLKHVCFPCRIISTVYITVSNPRVGVWRCIRRPCIVTLACYTAPYKLSYYYYYYYYQCLFICFNFSDMHARWSESKRDNENHVLVNYRSYSEIITIYSALLNILINYRGCKAFDKVYNSRRPCTRSPFTLIASVTLWPWPLTFWPDINWSAKTRTWSTVIL